MKAVQEWVRKVNEGGFDVAVGKIFVDTNENLYLSGHGGRSDEERRHVWIKRMLPDGFDLEQYIFREITRSSNPISVELDRENNFCLASSSGDFQEEQTGWLAKFSPAGDLLWRIEVEVTEKVLLIKTMSVDPSGNIYIAGEAGEAHHSSNPWVAKYSPDGIELWRKQLEAGGLFLLFSSIVDCRGDIYLAGSTDNKSWLAKCSADGAEIWQRQLTLPGSRLDAAVALATDGAENIYVACSFEEDTLFGAGGARKRWLAKLSPEGTELWNQQFGSSVNNDIFPRITTDSTGNLYLAGTIYDEQTTGTFKERAWITKYSPDGVQQWSYNFGSEDFRPFRIQEIAADGGGNLYLAGYEGVRRADSSGHSSTNLIGFMLKVRNEPETIADLNELSRLRFQSMKRDTVCCCRQQSLSTKEQQASC